MSQSSLQRRCLVALAVAVPLLAVIFLGPQPQASAQGQRPFPQPPRPPQPVFQPPVNQPPPQQPVFQPPPPQQPVFQPPVNQPRPPTGMPSPGVPQYENVWYCSKCNSELGRGPVKPTITRCPKCSASFGPGGWTGIGGIVGLLVAGLGFLFRKLRGD